MDKYSEILDFINEVEDALLQILASGFNICHQYTLRDIKDLTDKAETYGMKFAAEKLALIYEMLNLKQHNFEFDFSKMTMEYCRLNEYLGICREKLQLEKAEEGLGIE